MVVTIDVSSRSSFKYVLIVCFGVSLQFSFAYSCLSYNKPHKPLTKHFPKINTDEMQSISDKFHQYSQYLLQKYNTKISAEDISFLFEKWEEFKRSLETMKYNADRDSIDRINVLQQNQFLPDIFKLRDFKLKSPPSLYQLQKIIRDRDDSNLIINVKSSHKKKVNNGKIIRNRIFSKSEAHKALNLTKQFYDLQGGPCQPQQRSFCMKKYFAIHEKNHDIDFFYPPSFSVNRCSQEHCQCLHVNHECLPNVTRSSEHYMIGIDNQSRPWTWAFYITDHKGCHCKSRCTNRKCIKPFQLKFFDNVETCACSCPSGNEHRCTAILKGKAKFSVSDYFCIMSGRCLKPNCLLGELSEENLYHRMCPR